MFDFDEIFYRIQDSKNSINKGKKDSMNTLCEAVIGTFPGFILFQKKEILGEKEHFYLRPLSFD